MRWEKFSIGPRKNIIKRNILENSFSSSLIPQKILESENPLNQFPSKKEKRI